MNSRQTPSSQLGSLREPTAIILMVGVIFLGMLAAITWGDALVGASAAQKMQSLLGMDTVQLWWYVTRAAGLTGYFLLWLSMVWGLAIPSKIAQPVLDSPYTMTSTSIFRCWGWGSYYCMSLYYCSIIFYRSTFFRS